MSSALQLKKADFEVQVASNLGWGMGADNGDTPWTDSQKEQLRGFVQAGYSMFLETPPIEGFHPGNYEWSFRRPVVSLILVSGKQAVDFPEDTGGVEGLPMVSDGGSWCDMEWRSEPFIQNLYAKFTSPQTGVPLYATQRWKKMDGHAGHRCELYVFPQADADYTIKVQTYLTPDALSDSSPWAYGGVQHSQTIKYACLAASELELDGDPNGPMRTEFIRRLQTSIRADLKNKPQQLGRNTDRSDRARGSRWDKWHYFDTNYTATIQGSDPG